MGTTPYKRRGRIVVLLAAAIAILLFAVLVTATTSLSRQSGRTNDSLFARHLQLKGTAGDDNNDDVESSAAPTAPAPSNAPSTVESSAPTAPAPTIAPSSPAPSNAPSAEPSNLPSLRPTEKKCDPVDCDDQDDCTVDRCLAGGICENTLIDSDDCKKFVFVTSKNDFNGGFGGIVAADLACNLASTGSAVPSFIQGYRYFAWISTSTNDDPNSRFNKSNLPYFNSRGQKLANNYNDLVSGDELQASWAIDEKGERSTVKAVFPITSTRENGVHKGQGSCNGFTSTSSGLSANLLSSVGSLDGVEANAKSLRLASAGTCNQKIFSILCVQQ